jgi:predicted hotdog family 3-hydroxylacyl-ACP dehydratase
MIASDPPDIETLIPHRGPMRLIDRVIEIERSAITTLASVPTGGPFVAPDADPPGYMVIEMMAQTVSAWDGWQRRRQGHAPEIGFLLGTRRLRCDRETLAPGTSLRIDARLVFSDGEMACFVCTVQEGDGEPFAEATLNVFCSASPPDPEAEP